MKIFFRMLIGLLILSSCSNNDDNVNSASKTNIGLVTGINIRNSESSVPMKLGNPNVYTHNYTRVYPNPTNVAINISSSENITNVWIRPAKADKIFQQTDFNSILTSDTYSENQIQTDAEIEFTNINTQNLVVNVEDLNSGYYRIFMKINGKLYWDNIFIPEDDFEIDDIINFWN